MHVTLLTAQSLDGFITHHDQPGASFTSPEDKNHFRAALAGFDCGVMGGVTYRGAREWICSHVAVPKRLCLVLTRDPAAYAGEARPGELEFSAEAPAQLLAGLEARGRRHCALLGGGQVHALFLAAGLVDELWLTVEPMLFGRGTPLLAGPVDARLELTELKKLNSAGTLLLRYRVAR